MSRDKIPKELKVISDKIYVKRLTQFVRLELTKVLLDKELTEWSLFAIRSKNVAKRTNKIIKDLYGFIMNF